MHKVICLADSLIEYHSFWIRIGQYMESINKTYQVTVTDEPRYIEGMKNGDSLIIYRHRINWVGLENSIDKAIARGVRVISDIDDYLWFDGIERGWTKERLREYTRILKKCNTITCSTEHLKKQLEVMFRKQKIILMRNTASNQMKERSSNNQDKKIRIGWTGAPWTRPDDLKIIKPLAEWINSNKETIQLVHVGHREGLPSMAEILGIPENEVEKRDLTGHAQYLKYIDFDIGIAPLKYNCFNQFKSPIKVIEYSAYGIPWIASKVDVYEELCKSWNWNGRLCDKKEDWIENIWDLMENIKRETEGAQLKELCKKHSSFNSGVERWRDILKTKQ